PPLPPAARRPPRHLLPGGPSGVPGDRGAALGRARPRSVGAAPHRERRRADTGGDHAASAGAARRPDLPGGVRHHRDLDRHHLRPARRDAVRFVRPRGARRRDPDRRSRRRAAPDRQAGRGAGQDAGHHARLPRRPQGDRGGPGRWYHTGDVGYIDDDGFLFLVDRLTDVILVNGENVYPREIEEVIARYPGVARCAVVRMKLDSTGEAPHAFLVAEPGRTIRVPELMAYLRQHLAIFKLPRRVEIVDEIPTSPSGKILRRGLRVCSGS